MYNILLRKDVIINLEQLEGNIHTLDHEFCIYTKLKGGTGIPHVLLALGQHCAGTHVSCATGQESVMFAYESGITPV
jgi:hypothetical protein